MSFQTFTAAPNFPPEAGSTRATIAGFVVDYTGAVAPTDAEVQARTAPTAAQVLAALRSVAATLASDPGAEEKLIRAVLLLAMDENNVLRARLRAQDAAIAASALPAAFKTAWAALAPVPDRTASQIKPALVARIGTSDAD